MRPRNPAIREPGPIRTPQKTAPATPTPHHHPWREKLNAPTGAWCSLTYSQDINKVLEERSQCTYRCVVLPDAARAAWASARAASQCTYRCVVLPDPMSLDDEDVCRCSLNAPTGAWCSLTCQNKRVIRDQTESQCTYRCVVLPDIKTKVQAADSASLNAPTGAWCSLTPEEGK